MRKTHDSTRTKTCGYCWLFHLNTQYVYDWLMK